MSNRVLISFVIFLYVFALSAGTVRTLAGKSYSGYVRFVDESTLGIGPAKGEVVKVPLDKVVFASFEPPDDLTQVETGSPLSGKGTGLLGAYFSRPGYKGRVVYRIDEEVDFNWGMERPSVDVNRDYFSIRWTGELEAPATGVYTFFVDANDGAELTIGDKFKVGQMDPEAGFLTKGKISLEAGKRYPLKLEFYDNYGQAHMHLHWSGPGISKTIVPSRQLYPTLTLPGNVQKLNARQGLLGCYFKNRFFYGDVFLRVDSKVDFNWDKGPAENFAADNYSVRWMGQLESEREGEYLIHLTADEGVRLWLGGQLIINDLRNQGRNEINARIELKRKSRYDFRLEMVNRRGGTKLHLGWTPPAGNREPMPLSSLHATFEPPPPDVAAAGKVDVNRTLGVFTWGGSRIAHAASSADGTSVKFEEGQVPSRLSTVNVARIVFQPIPEQFTANIPGAGRGVLLKSGDFVEGKFHSFKEGVVSIQSTLFGRREYGILDVLVLQLDKIKGPPAVADFTAELEDGSRYHLRSCRLEKDRLEFDDPTIGRFKIQPQELIELKRISAKE